MTDPRWQDALAAAALLAVDPVGLGGVVVRAAPGPVRDAWLAALNSLLVAGTPVRRIPAQIPDARLHVFENAGHMGNIECADEFNALCLEFLTGVDG